MMKFLKLAFFAGALFLLASFARAGDPNLKMPDCSNLPTKQNVKDIKDVFKEIRNIYTHDNVMYLHLHDKERAIIKEKLPEQPSLEVYLH